MDENSIDKEFKNFLKKFPPPNNDKQWLEYLNVVYADAYANGANYVFKMVVNETEKLHEEENKKG